MWFFLRKESIFPYDNWARVEGKKREYEKKKVEKKEYENRNRGFKMYVFVR